MSCLLVCLAEADAALIPWARRIAHAQGQELIVLCVSKGPTSRLDKAVPGGSDLSALSDAVANRPELAGVVVYDCPGPRPRRGVLDAVATLGAQHVVLPAVTTDPQRGLVQDLGRAIPVTVLALDVGGVAISPKRILIPQVGGGGADAIRFASKHLMTESVGVCVVADPQAVARSRRVFRRTRERISESRRDRVRQVEIGATLGDGVSEILDGADLILLDADHPRQIVRHFTAFRAMRQARSDAPFAIGVLRDARAAGPGRLERLIERFRMHIPILSREERRDVHEVLERGGRLSIDFVMMLMLSTSIATLGLIQSSTATVIGAMLVAPLMTPLLAIGMALVQANNQLFRKATAAASAGIVGALAASMIIALLSPWSDLSAEVVARGGPNAFDLGIALLSGVAAAFALSRAGLSGTLVGVAIAVALVPPLASVGIATVKGEFGVALGAAVLFLTNLLAIIIGAGLVFRVVGLDASKRGRATPRWVILSVLVILIALVPTVGVLFSNLRAQIDQGVQRPYARPLAAAIRDQIRERVARSPGVEILSMSESGIEHGFGHEVALVCTGAVDPTLVADIKAILVSHGTPESQTRVLLLRSAE